jgi:hypothetical protein
MTSPVAALAAWREVEMTGFRRPSCPSEARTIKQLCEAV